MNYWVSLPNRNVFKLQGPEVISFLQGLATQDMRLLETQVVFSAFLNAQGRFLGDFFAFQVTSEQEKSIFVECHGQHGQRFLQILERYAALHKISWRDESKSWALCAAVGPQAGCFLSSLDLRSPSPFSECFFYDDPRDPRMGWRGMLPYAAWNEVPHPLLLPQSYETYRSYGLSLGIPEGYADLLIDKAIILEYGYQFLNAISWHKGCYTGQELMARTFHQGQIQKSLFTLDQIQGHPPTPGSSLYDASGQKWGRMGGYLGALGLACLNSQHVAASSQEFLTFYGPAGEELFTAQVRPPQFQTQALPAVHGRVLHGL